MRSGNCCRISGYRPDLRKVRWADAYKQVTEKGKPVADVAQRLGMSVHSLYAWIKLYSKPQEQRQQDDDQQAELRKLRAELKRVTEERDILKKAAAYFAKECG